MKLQKLLFISLCCIFFCGCQQSKAHLPPIMLWAWQAPQDLRGLNPAQFGIAQYIGTITMRENKIVIAANRQPMAIPTNLYRMAVIHLSINPSTKNNLDQNTVQQITQAVITLFNNSGIKALQLDFSAMKSQQAFYVELIKSVHAQLDPKVYFSITALANWCVGDRWLLEQHLPVDLVVPMYFSLAQKQWQKMQFITSFPMHINSLTPECRNAIGLATFETWQVPLQANVPIFVFTRGSWTKEKIKQAIITSEKISVNVK